MKNFPFETQHTCFSIDNELKMIRRVSSHEVSMMVDTNETNHNCTCCFFQIFMRICDNNFKKVKLDKLFMTFLKSYKFKYLYGFSYISLYKDVVLNGNKHIQEFSVQVLTNEDVGLAIASSEDLMSGLFWSLNFLTNRYIEEEEDLENMNDNEFYEIVFRFFIDVFYLCKPKPCILISQYVGILKILTDVLCIIQNKIKFKKASSFQYEGFRESFVTIEMYLLNLFSLLTTIFDFSYKKNANEILFYIIDKLRLGNYAKLEDDEFSFHIPVNRALAIFLNRFSISVSVQENIDFYLALKNILYDYYSQTFDAENKNSEGHENEEDNSNKDIKILKNYSYDEFLLMLVKNTTKTLGFINSIPCKNWVYYGENMLFYNYLFYSIDVFRLCDFSLLKLVLSQDHSGSILNIEDFLNLSNINESYTEFKNNLFTFKKLEDFTGKNLFVKNFDVIIRLFRNNSILLDLLTFSYDKLKENKCEDQLFLKLMEKEKDSLIEDVKIRLAHIIVSKENSIYFSEINKVLPFYIKEYFKADTIEEIINQICEKVISKNKLVNFRLKKEYFSLIDLYYISNPQKEAGAERYLLEFKKKEVCLLNTPHFKTFEFIKLINANMTYHFFRNEKNINLLVNITIDILNKISSNELTSNYSFVINFMKIIDIYVDNCMHSGLLSKYEQKFLNKDLMNCLNNFNSSDENVMGFSKKLLERLVTLYNTNEKDNVMITLTSKKDEIELKKQMMKQRKEKMAEMYKNKVMAFKEFFQISEEGESILNQTAGSEKVAVARGFNQLPVTENQQTMNTLMSIDNNLINIHTDKTIPIISNVTSDKNNEPDTSNLTIPLEKQVATIEKNFDCVICRNKINPQEFLEKPFGRIGVFSKSNFIYHSKLQTLKKEYEKNIVAKKKSLLNKQESESNDNISLDHREQLEVKELMLTFKRSKPELKNGIRYSSCNHHIHFSCYLSYIMKYVIGNTESKHLIFICPLCKGTSNNYIPNFDLIREISNNKNSSYDILSGINFEELFSFYKEILSQNTTINHVNLNFFNYRENSNFNKSEFNEMFLPSLSYFLENIVSTQLKSSFLISDFKNKINQEKYYESFLNFFINSLNMLDILKDEDIFSLLDVLKDYLISLRILIKTETIDPQIFFNRLINIQFYWNTDFVTEENIVNNLESDKVSQLFFENLFLILVLFEEKELNYLNIIFRHFSPLFFIQFFLMQLYTNYSYKINLQIFQNQFNFVNFMYILMSHEDCASLKTFLLFYLKKICLLKSIFDTQKFSENNKTINLNFNNLDTEFEYYMNCVGLNTNSSQNNQNSNMNALIFTSWLKLDETLYPPFWIFREDLKEHAIKIFNNYYNSKSKQLEIGTEENQEEGKTILFINNLAIIDFINPALLLINNNLNFHFISIPQNMLDLSTKYYKIICNHCKTSPIYNLLCLTCGEKICYMENCCKNYGKKKNIYEYVWHNKICGNGDGVFLHLHSGEISFAFLGNFVNSKVSIYLNKYGEILKTKSITDDYKLNEDLLKTIFNEYKNLKYRKYFRIKQGMYNLDAEEEEMI